MKRMKKALAFALASSLMLLSGCMDVTADGSSDFKQENLTKIAHAWNYDIYQHDATGVCYLVWGDEEGTGITVMLNADGTPYTGN